MKKLLVIISAMILFAFGTASFAEIKIGVVNLQKVMLESPQMAAAKDKLKSKFDSREKEVIAAQKAFQSDVDAFNKNSPTMKDNDKKAAQQKLVDQSKKLQDLQNKFQNDLNAAQTEAMQVIVKKIESVVNKIAMEKNIGLMVALAATAYHKPELDVTDDVIKQMKK
jgi:outer membrane protein